MNTANINFRILLPILIFGLCLLSTPQMAGAAGESAAAETTTAIDTGTGLPYKNDGLVMKVDTNAATMIVLEKEVLVTQYKVGEEVLKTTLLSTGGTSVELSSFKEGQRVRVVGFLMPDNRIVAQSIQKVSSSSSSSK